jgi:hypothetical protein
VVDRLVIEVFGWDNLLDDLLENLFSELLGGDIFAMLSRDDDGVHTKRDDGTAIMCVLDSDLSLGVRSQPGQSAGFASLLHGGIKLVREQQCQGEQLRGLISSVTKHDTLVTSTELLHGLFIVQTLGNVWRLLLNGDEHIASLVVEALVGVIVANILDSVTNDLLVVKMGLGGNLAEDHDHASLGSRLAGDLGERVVLEAGIQDGIGDLVARRIISSVLESNTSVKLGAGTIDPYSRQGSQMKEEKEESPTHQILSGCPSPTDSDVKRNVPWITVRI